MRHKLLFLCAFLLIPATAPALSGSLEAGVARETPLVHALFALGTRFRYGGRSPEAGFDCSGLVAHVYHAAWGLALPHSAKALSRSGRPVKAIDDLRPGDLVFYNTRQRPYSHVGIYIGEGQFIHAPRTGKTVRIESLEKPYWRVRFNGARRLDPPRL